ncbi:hypothetical protein ACFQLX_11770 [Streptomyces polyrhachis]|uniref:Peptidase inhibitor family I36 n=1 Tax=Streptomyces polyrhachis TaxID=1282885 RepID=A0ABW2GE27_9ACTN
MNLKKTFATMASAAIVAGGLGIAGAAPAHAAGSKCGWVGTADMMAGADVCWEWVSDGKGAYNGVITVWMYDSSSTNGTMRVEANGGDGWYAIAGASSNVVKGEKDITTFTGLKTIYFQACSGPSNCGSDLH